MFVTVSFAQEYGMGGCGPGSVIIGKSGIQSFASTSNFTWFPIKYGALSSGTSNCVEDEIAMGTKEQQFFFSANYESLKQEMAQGEGENLTAFISLVGCQGQDAESAQQVLQANYDKIFTSELVNPGEALDNTQKVIYSSDIDSCIETI